jgi:hypothetical protein
MLLPSGEELKGVIKSRWDGCDSTRAEISAKAAFPKQSKADKRDFPRIVKNIVWSKIKKRRLLQRFGAG